MSTETVPPVKRVQGHKGYKNRRRLSRELALQGIYQWQVTGGNARDIGMQLQQVSFFSKADGPYFSDLLQGVLEHAADLQTQIQPHLDRQMAELSPVECSILLIGTYEMVYRPEIPCRAIINEAIELPKAMAERMDTNTSMACWINWPPGYVPSNSSTRLCEIKIPVKSSGSHTGAEPADSLPAVLTISGHELRV